MTDIAPTLRKVVKPTLKTLLENFRHDLLKNLNCVKVGQIKSYSAGGANQIPTATVLIAQQQVTSIDVKTGVRTLAEYPLLVNVPVYFPGGGGVNLTFPVSAGDECLVLFNDRQLENWIESGPGQAPTLPNLHNLSDGICLVGIRSNPRALSDISTTVAQLRTDDGTVHIDVGPSLVTVFAPNVKVHAGISYSWDVNGYGQKITWTGGSNYTIDNYVTGATVTTNNHAIDPPESP